MVRKVSLLVAFWLLASLLVPGIVHASYGYYIPITVYNNGSSELSGPFLITLNNSQLAEMGYISSSGLDTDVVEGAVGRDYSVSSGRLAVYVPSLVGYQSRTYNYKLGEDPPKSSFPVMVGSGGYVTVSDHAELELGNAFSLTFTDIYLNTTAGANKDIVIKVDAFRFYVNGTIDGRIDFGITGGASVYATGLASGLYGLKVVSDATNLRLYVDGILRATSPMSSPVPDNSNNLVFFKSAAVLHIGSFKLES